MEKANSRADFHITHSYIGMSKLKFKELELSWRDFGQLESSLRFRGPISVSQHLSQADKSSWSKIMSNVHPVGNQFLRERMQNASSLQKRQGTAQTFRRHAAENEEVGFVGGELENAEI